MIDEKKLIKEIEKRINFWKDRAATEESEFGAELKMVMAAEATKILDVVNNQPKVGEWIPCSERLPEYTSNYLVTVMIGSPFGAYKEVRSAIYNTKTGWCVYESADEIANVIAWAESPKPWEGKMMINMELDANTAEDWKVILELQKMGIPDEAIQIAYNNTVRKRKEKNGIIQEVEGD